MDLTLEQQEQIIGGSKEQSRKNFCRGYALALRHEYGREMNENEIGEMMDRFEDYWMDRVKRLQNE